MRHWSSGCRPGAAAALILLMRSLDAVLGTAAFGGQLFALGAWAASRVPVTRLAEVLDERARGTS